MAENLKHPKIESKTKNPKTPEAESNRTENPKK
ncbi:uncharacterized protein G2W53_019152 [Senna tora]|uniref:Uncharacterized protein n=1 Tax=Senna tora TaxID=362788 RepID=A0A834WNZ4_9FABA|nr:uncharacterized protein G2W53_019152 [Senna tora]